MIFMGIKSKYGINSFLYLILFCASLNFVSRFYVFAFLAFFIFLLTRKTFEINNCAFLYIFLCVLMLFYHYDDGVLGMLKCLSYCFFYLIGYSVVQDGLDLSLACEETQNKSVKNAHSILLWVSSGSFMHYALNFIINVNQDLGRDTNDIWSGETMAATGQAALGCLMLGIAIAMLIFPRKKGQRLIGGALLLSIMAHNLILAGRTLIVICLVVFVLGIAFYLKNSNNFSTGLKVFGWVAAIGIGGIMMYVFNIGGIKDAIMSSNLVNRFTGDYASNVLDSGRGSIKLSYLQNMWKYPWGGLHMRDEFNYAHDLWLDGYDEDGIFALVLLIGITLTGLRDLIVFLRNQKFYLGYKISFVCVYSSILLVFCVEPILAGMQWLFACYCLINGCLAGVNSVSNQLE